MKKLLLTIAIVLGINYGAYPQFGGGLFQYGEVTNEYYYGSVLYVLDQNNSRTPDMMPVLPGHGSSDNQDAVPLGGGALLLFGFATAYALRKKKETTCN